MTGERYISVGEIVIWHSRTGPVAAEFRGWTRDEMGGRAVGACIIVRCEGEPPYQTVVSANEIQDQSP